MLDRKKAQLNKDQLALVKALETFIIECRKNGIQLIAYEDDLYAININELPALTQAYYGDVPDYEDNSITEEDGYKLGTCLAWTLTCDNVLVDADTI